MLNENKVPKVKYIYSIDTGRVLGSVRYVINLDTFEAVQEIDYDENGNVLRNTNPEFQPLGYAGGLYDRDTKLTRFGARDYDPTIGRWTTKDPIGFQGGTTNLYEYANSSPLSYYDDDGMAPKDAFGRDTGGGGPGLGNGGRIPNSTVYVSPNGQAVFAPQGSIVSPTRSGGGLRIDTGSAQFRLMGPNGQSPNGYGKININGRFMDGSGNLLHPGSGNLPAAHIQPTCSPKGK